MGLRIKRINWRDSFIFSGEYDIELPETGLILVEGKNLDAGGSNGAGKTSFLNLIPTCLFEQNNSGLIKDKIINSFAKEGFIKLYLDDDYIIEYRRVLNGKSDWSVRKNGVLLKGERTTDTKSIILDLLGIDYIQYTSAVHLCQGATLGFFLLSPSERLNMLVSMLNLAKFDIASQKAKEKVNELLVILSGINSRYDEINSQINLLEQEINKLEILEIDINKLRQERLELEGKIQEEIDLQKKLNQTFVSLKLEFEKLRYDEQRLLTEYKELEGIDKKRKYLEQQHKEVLNEIARIEMSDIDEEQLVKEVQDIENEIGDIERQLQKIVSEFELSNHKIQEFNKILSLGIGDLCPICGNPLSEKKFNERKKHIKKEIEQEERNINKLKQKQEDMELRKSELKMQLEKLLQKQRFYRQQQIELVKFKEQSAYIVKQLNDLPERTYGDKILANINVIRKEIDKIEKEINKINTQMVEKEGIIRRFNDELKNKLILIANYEKQQEFLEIKKQKLQELKGKLNELIIEQKDKELDSEYYKWWIMAFKKIKMLELEQAIGFLQERLNEYLQLLFDNRIMIEIDVFKYKKTKKDEFDFKNELNITINNSDIPIEGFSGGEKQLMGLAMLFALNDYFGFNLILLDEVFGSLDLVNRERVIKLLSNLRYKKLLLVISHLDDIKSALDWDFVYVIERYNNASKFYIEKG